MFWQLFGGEISTVKELSLHCDDPWIRHLIHVCFRFDMFMDVFTSEFLNHSVDLLSVLHVLLKTPRGM